MRYSELSPPEASMPVVYRGSDHDNAQRSSMAPDGVYITTRQETAEQWGQPRAYRFIRMPRLLDLSNWYGSGKMFAAKLHGVSPASLSKQDFVELAMEIFVQNQGVAYLRHLGFDGYRLGDDMFLLGDLKDWCVPT